MKATIYRPPLPLNSVTLGGMKNQPLFSRFDVAVRHSGRSRADMLRVIVEDWLSAWEASGGEARVGPGSPRYVRQNPLHGKRVPFTGDEIETLRAPKPADEGGVLVPFRPRQEEL